MDILALGAVGVYSIYKSYRSKNGGKFYSAPETKKHYDNISAEFESYSKLAEALRGEMDAIATTDSYQGDDADGVKQLMYTTEPETLDMILDLHKKIEQYFADVIDAFARDVDSSPEAFLSFDMLDLIKQDFWDMLNDYNTEAKIAKEKIEEYSNKYSAKYNHTITIPDFTPGTNAFLALCGEEDGDGADDYLSKCQKMLVDFDEAMATHLADLNLMDLVDSINQRLIAQIVEQYPELKDIKNLNVLENRYKEIRAEELLGNPDAVLSEVDREIIDEVVTKKYNELNTYHKVSDTYGFEDLVEEVHNGYQMTNVERKALTMTYENSFSVFDNGIASDADKDKASRLLKGLIYEKEPEHWYSSSTYETDYDLIDSILYDMDIDSMAYAVVSSFNCSGNCSKDILQYITFDFENYGAGVAITFNVDCGNPYAMAPKHEEMGLYVSQYSALNYVNSIQKDNSGYGNGLDNSEVARILTYVKSRDDMDFMDCLLNDHDYSDAFAIEESKITDSAIEGLVNYHMDFYQVDDNGFLISNADGSMTKDTQEFISLANAALYAKECGGYDKDYTTRMYLASEIQTNTFGMMLASIDRTNPDNKQVWLLGYNEFNREVMITDFYGVLATQSSLMHERRAILNGTVESTWLQIESISQNYGNEINVSCYKMTQDINQQCDPSKRSDYSFILKAYDSDEGENMLFSDNISEYAEYRDELDAEIKKQQETLGKDIIVGVSAFGGPELAITAAVACGALDTSSGQFKTSANQTWNNGMKRLGQMKYFAGAENKEKATILSNVTMTGSLAINVSGDIYQLYMSEESYAEKLEEKDKEYKALWFGTGCSYEVGEDIYMFYNNNIVSPQCISNIETWQSDGIVEVIDLDLTIDSDEYEKMKKFWRDRSYSEEDIHRYETILFGSENGELQLLKMDSYVDFNKDISRIQEAYAQATGDDINILEEWGDSMQ